MGFAPCARIDLGALRHNLFQARRAAPDQKIMAVIKANAYGHGLESVAAALAGADALAVARVSEAAQLRRAGIRGPILVLEGAFDGSELQEAVDLDLQVVVHAPEQRQLLGAVHRPLKCWIKLDTGMHRLGFPPEQLAEVRRAIAANPRLELAGLMTHLACADDRDDPVTLAQVQAMHEAAGDLGLPVSIANSSGVLGWSESHADWVRPGLMLYGISPFPGESAANLGLRPAMTLSARLLAIKPCRAGSSIGYGGTFQCPVDMSVGVVGIGYGDGYPRELGSGMSVALRGKRAPIAGRVSMDMLSVDLRGIPEAKVGDEVILWGDELPVEEVAAAVGTIPYTLVCGVTQRVRRDYVESASSLREAGAR